MRERAGKALDRLLAGGAGRRQRHGGQRHARGHVDDHAGPAFTHLRYDGLARRHDAERIGGEDLADMHHGRRLEGISSRDMAHMHLK